MPHIPVNTSARLRNQIYVCAYVVVWFGALMVLRSTPDFEVSDALIAFAVLGVAMPALAVLASRGMQLVAADVRRPWVEAAALLAYLVLVAWLLVGGLGRFVPVAAEPAHSLGVLGIKLIVFVLLPGVMIALIGGYSLRELAPVSLRARGLRPALWMAIAALAMEAFMGRGLQDIKAAHLPAWVLVVAAPLSFSI